MKHIKLFEDWDMVHKPGKYKYKAGDYVIIDNSGDAKWHVNLCVKILDENSNQNRHDEKPNIDYYIETFLLDNHKMIERFWLYEDEIERLASAEEIDDYEMKINVNKYNL
jgi:hypothetical protein